MKRELLAAASCALMAVVLAAAATTQTQDGRSRRGERRSPSFPASRAFGRAVTASSPSRRTEWRPTGSRLFFLSQRPVVDGKLTFPYVEKIWMMTRYADGWSEPQKLFDEVNKVAGAHWQLSVDAQHNLYFGARGGVHVARFAEGRNVAAERLGPAINDGKTPSFSPFIAPDASYLIFSRPHPVYTYQLFISFRRPDGAWNEARNLSEALHHPYSLNGRVTPDGKYLFFTGRNGVDCWVEAFVIEALRPQASRGGTR